MAGSFTVIRGIYEHNCSPPEVGRSRVSGFLQLTLGEASPVC